MTKKQFCDKYGLTEGQFSGAEKYTSSLDDLRHGRDDFPRFETRSGLTTDVGIAELPDAENQPICVWQKVTPATGYGWYDTSCGFSGGYHGATTCPLCGKAVKYANGGAVKYEEATK